MCCPPPGRNAGTRRTPAVLFIEEVAGRDHATRGSPPPGSPPARPSTSGTNPLLHPAPTQHALRTLEWVDRHENLVVCGPSGTGKSQFLEALGQRHHHRPHRRLVQHRELGVLVRRHRADDSITRAIPRILRADLIMVDDIGMLPVGDDAAEGLYRLVDACYEKRSLAVSSNLHPSGFDEIMPKTLATATVDRLLHHAHICVTNGQRPPRPSHHRQGGDTLAT